MQELKQNLNRMNTILSEFKCNNSAAASSSSFAAIKPAKCATPQNENHSNLMAAIRQAGGKPKSVNQTTANNQDLSTPKSPEGGEGEITSDLHKKLATRRKVMKTRF